MPERSSGRILWSNERTKFHSGEPSEKNTGKIVVQITVEIMLSSVATSLFCSNKSLSAQLNTKHYFLTITEGEKRTISKTACESANGNDKLDESEAR